MLRLDPAANQPPNVGTERIQQWTQGFLAAFRADFTIVPHDIELAQEDSRVDSTMQLPGPPLVIAAAPSQNPGMSWLAMN